MKTTEYGCVLHQPYRGQLTFYLMVTVSAYPMLSCNQKLTAVYCYSMVRTPSQCSGNSDHVVRLIYVASCSALSSINPASDRLPQCLTLALACYFLDSPILYSHHPQDKMPQRQFSVLVLPPTFHPFLSPSPDRSDLSLCPKAVKPTHPLLLLHRRTGSWGITARPVGSL